MKQINKRAFTLVELLVVVLIIGILAAIAVPQYQKAVLKADMHRGVSLVESLYQAQQSYYLTHGTYAVDIDNLDVSIPKDSSCVKTIESGVQTIYDCDYGRIYNHTTTIQFQNKPNRNGVSLGDMAYARQLESTNDFEAGRRYCYAKTNNNTAKAVCQELGGEEMPKPADKWTYYEIK